MTQNQTNVIAGLSKVDGLYGLGTTSGWYLTLLACLVSWTMQPKKRKRDSIDADLVVGLTLPTVAVVHLISQVRRLSTIERGTEPGGIDQSYVESRYRAIEAPLVIIEAFMDVSLLMFMVAFGYRRFRRALIYATAGLLCFASECYLHWSKTRSVSPRLWFSRLFVSDSAAALVGNGVILAVMAVVILVITTGIFRLYNQEHHRLLTSLREESQRIRCRTRDPVPLRFRSRASFEGSGLYYRYDRIPTRLWAS